MPFTDAMCFSLQCEPLYGWGFRRGGYKCMCKPGYRYPQFQNGPFLGSEIESATEEEYKNGFAGVAHMAEQVAGRILGA